MQLYCRQCGAEIQSADINLDNMIAKCAACNAVFSFADMYDEPSHQKTKNQVLQYDVPMPNGFTIHEGDSTLTIERKWFSFTHIVLIVFGVIWNCMIWFIFVPNFSEIGGAFSLFLLPFIAAGIGLIYVAIAGFFNTTTISVNDAELNISHAPIPFPGKQVASGNIEQLYTRRKVSRSKNGTSVSYQLRVMLRDGTERLLIQSLEKPEQAIFIEQEIERFLNIEDIPVRGEYR